MNQIQLDVLGIFAHESQEVTFTLLLSERGGDRKLPIIIGLAEAQAIALTLENKPRINRPTMLDLFKNALTKLGYTIQKVVITGLKDSIFFSQMVITNGTTMVSLDARPSDAIAIGLHFSAPLYTSESLLNQAAALILAIPQEPDIKLQPSISTGSPQKVGTNFQHYSIEILKKLLATVVEQEDYEQAILIRDELARRGT